MYHGEGYFDFWVNGYSRNDQIYTALRCTEATKKETEETEPRCVVDEGDKEWWVRIKTKSGQTGWVEGNIGFDGIDACG
jgi:hypothetical protein